MSRPKSAKSRTKGIRIRMSEEEMNMLEHISMYHPGETKAEIIRNYIKNEYEKHINGYPIMEN